MKDVDEEIIDMVTKTNARNTAPQTVDFPLPMSTKKRSRKSCQLVQVCDCTVHTICHVVVVPKIGVRDIKNKICFIKITS